MPSLAVALPWVVVALATLAVRAWFAAIDAPGHHPGARSNHSVAEWDDGTDLLPARVVASGPRIHLWIPRTRRIVLTPLDNPGTTTADTHTDAWRVDLAGQTQAALYDIDGALAHALIAAGSRPSRFSLRDRLFLRAPRWTLSALLGCVVLGTGMAGLSALGEHHRVTVERIITDDDNIDCVLDWPGKQAQGPHVTACPDDEDQHVGDRIDAVRLPTSDYVVATDESHLTYVSFLAFAGAAFLALLAAFFMWWRLVLRTRTGTYTPMPHTPHLRDASDATPRDTPEHDVVPTTAETCSPLLSPQAWTGLLDDDRPPRVPAHSGSLWRRFTWRLNSLPLPWFSFWACAISANHLDDHRRLFTVTAVIAGLFVVRGLVRSIMVWSSLHRAPDPHTPQTTYAYVRLPRPQGLGNRQAKDTVLVLDPHNDEGPACLLELDGTPAATGSITLIGTLSSRRMHPRVQVNGRTFETAGDPTWLDADEVEDIHDDLERRARLHSL